MLNELSAEIPGISAWHITVLCRNNRTGLLRISLGTRTVMIHWNGAQPGLISVAWCLMTSCIQFFPYIAVFFNSLLIMTHKFCRRVQEHQDLHISLGWRRVQGSIPWWPQQVPGESSYKQGKLMTVLPQKTCFSVHQFAAEWYCVQKGMSRDVVVLLYAKPILGRLYLFTCMQCF